MASERQREIKRRRKRREACQNCESPHILRAAGKDGADRRGGERGDNDLHIVAGDRNNAVVRPHDGKRRHHIAVAVGLPYHTLEVPNQSPAARIDEQSTHSMAERGIQPGPSSPTGVERC